MALKSETDRMRSILPLLKEDYRDRLVCASCSNSPQMVGNRYPWHTKIAVEELLRIARGGQSVCIVSGSLAEFYVADLIDLLRECVNDGSRVRIVVWHNDPSVIPDSFRTSFRASTPGAKGGSLEIRFAGVDPSAVRVVHFCLVGSNYRREDVHPDFKGKTFTDFDPEVRATVGFNDTVGAQILRHLFDLAWGIASPI